MLISITSFGWNHKEEAKKYHRPSSVTHIKSDFVFEAYWTWSQHRFYTLRNRGCSFSLLDGIVIMICLKSWKDDRSCPPFFRENDDEIDHEWWRLEKICCKYLEEIHDSTSSWNNIKKYIEIIVNSHVNLRKRRLWKKYLRYSWSRIDDPLEVSKILRHILWMIIFKLNSDTSLSDSNTKTHE